MKTFGRSDHILLWDYDAEEARRCVLEFLEEVAGAPAADGERGG